MTGPEKEEARVAMGAEPAPVEPPDDEAADRKTAPIRFLIVATVVMVVATLIARFGLAAIERRARGLPDDIASGPKRLARFMELLPPMAQQPGDASFILGSSLAYFGVALGTFDRRMGELGVPVTTFTAATPMVTPAVELALTRQIERTFEREHKNVELMLIEFTPQGLTTASARAGGGFYRVPLGELAAVGDIESVAALALEHPDDAAHVVAMTALDNQDSQTIEEIVKKKLFGERTQDSAPTQLQRALFRKFGEAAGPWNPRSRGEPNWLIPESQLPYLVIMKNAAERKRKNRGDMIRQLASWNDAFELHFDEKRLATFVEIVKKSQSFARHTVVFIAPRNPEFNVPTADGRERLGEALARLKSETHVPVVDLGEMPDIGPDDFFDAQHVTEHAGRPKVSLALAQGVARIVEDEEQGGDKGR